MNITFRQLRIFIEVVQRGSMIRAATALHLSPPAVSMQIKQIEKQVGLPLFDRDKRKVSLSKAGENFVVYARHLLGSLKEAEDAMSRFKALDQGKVTIGIIREAARFVPRLLAHFNDEHPGIDMRLRVVHTRAQLIGLISDAEVDLMVMSRPPKELAASAEAFAANPFVFVCPPQDPLHHVTLSVKDLNEHALIVREHGSNTRAVMDTFLAEHRSTPKVTMEIPSTEATKHAVMAGMGLGFLALHAISLELRNGLIGVLDIVDTPVMDAWNIVHLPSRVLSPAAEAFRHFLIDQGKKDLKAHNSMLLSLAFRRKTSKRR